MDVSDGQYIPLLKNDLRPLYPPMALIDRYFCDRKSSPTSEERHLPRGAVKRPHAPRRVTPLLRIRLAGAPTPRCVADGTAATHQKTRRVGLLILQCCNNLRPFSPCEPPNRAVRDAKSRTAPLPSRAAARDHALAALHPVGLGHKEVKPPRYATRNVKFERRGKIGVTKKGIWFPEEMF